MFPADKKRVESALAAAHLPKGKVGNDKLMPHTVLAFIYPFFYYDFMLQYDSMKPDVFTEAAFRTFMMNLCPRPEIYEIFTS